jgi:hypothetical protein
MSGRSTRRAVAPPPVQATAAAWPTPTDLLRQQMAWAMEGACVLLRGVQAIRKLQAHAAHQALEWHDGAAKKLHGGCQLPDLVAVQTDLLRFTLESSTQYWQEISAEVLEMRTDLFECCVRCEAIESAAHPASAAFLVPATETFTRMFQGYPRLGTS